MKKTINLNAVQETLLLPLWGRAMESRKQNPLLTDKTALEIIETADYDFSTIEKNISKISCASWIARSIWFDEKIKAFLDEHPDGTIINAGCGLDTTYDRVDNGRAMWYEIDMEDVIALRKHFINENNRRKFISASLTDEKWYRQIKRQSKVLLMLAGVIYYFDDSQVKEFIQSLRNTFDGCTLIFDYCSKIGLRMANQQVIKAGGMDSNALLKFGIDEIREVENWVTGTHVVENFPLFRDHRRKYPPLKRIGMMVSDSLKIMSLTRIEIEAASGNGKPAPSKAAAKNARTGAGTKTKTVSKKAGGVPAKKKTTAKRKTRQ